MCYSTRQTRKVEKLENHYRVTRLLGNTKIEDDLILYHSNGFTHPLMWVIPQEERTSITPAMWGIMPSNKSGADHEQYYKESVRFGAGLNAQSEKLFNHFIYKYSALSKRCIIPVDGFFEPHTAPKKFKIPFYFERKDSDIMSLAGIYTTTKDGFNTFTILTKPATPLFAKIHNTKNRRPVILNDEDIDVWLDNSLNENDVMEVIDKDMDDVLLNAYSVSKDLYSRKVDSNRPDIIEKVDYKELEIRY
jgi:putative SOS response-associated peptidase YedK